MKVLLTGAAGFLGWHTRVRLAAVGGHDVVAVSRHDWPRLAELIADVDAVVHVAGINRGSHDEVQAGNVTLARDLATALPKAMRRPVVVFANSIQAGNSTPYGMGKGEAAGVLGEAAAAHGSAFVDVHLPNIFGEHGRARYNSFVATFVEAVIEDRVPTVEDRPITLLHVQAAAQALLDAVSTPTTGVVEPDGTATTVVGVLDRLRSFRELYRRGDVPPLMTDLDVDLFNTLRAALFPAAYPLPLVQRADRRGALVEVVRAHGGQGQTFVSTTRPGITRGEHFHLRKVERFVVVAGQARISLRRLHDTEVISFDVDGERPVVVDMPTLWAHNITNTGDRELTTLFWANELFDPDRPDTYPEPVAVSSLDAAGTAR